MLKSIDLRGTLFEIKLMNNKEKGRDYFAWSSPPHPSTQRTKKKIGDSVPQISRASHQVALSDKNSLVAVQSSL